MLQRSESGLNNLLLSLCRNSMRMEDSVANLERLNYLLDLTIQEMLKPGISPDNICLLTSLYQEKLSDCLIQLRADLEDSRRDAKNAIALLGHASLPHSETNNPMPMP